MINFVEKFVALVESGGGIRKGFNLQFVKIISFVDY